LLESILFLEGRILIRLHLHLHLQRVEA
jgi:hypothetical protein